MNKNKNIIILGLNAVWQKNISFDELKIGEVHRAKKVKTYASGKGTNVAWALSRCGHRHVTLLQACGGHTGQLIAKDLDLAPFQTSNISIASESRVCTTLLESQGRCTELIEPSPELSVNEWHLLALTLKNLMGSVPCDVLVSGSFPLGSSDEIVEVLSQRRPTASLWVDSVDSRWLTLSPEVLKVNRHELRQLCSEEPASNTKEVNFAQAKVIEEQIQTLAKQHGVSRLVVTNEEQRGWFWHEKKCQRFTPTAIEHPVNVIGAGDTFLAGLVFAHQKQLNFGQAVDFASRLAAKRCQVETLQELTPCELIT
jgi:1-phosphofructokinase